MLHIHKVQKLTGVTARTLRYYDSIDLLKPAMKSEGGHRLYTFEEIKKLQQIQFLQQIGFRLKEIKRMLHTEDWNWSDSLRRQLSFVKKEQEHLQQMEHSLRELLNGIKVEGENEWTAIQNVMQLSQMDHKIKKDYRESIFNEKEVDLWEKVPDMASDHPDSLEWIALIGQLNQHIKEGPHASKVQNIIRRMDEKRLETFSGEEEFINKLWDVRMSAKESEKLGLYPISQEVLEFMDEAYTIYIENQASNRRSDSNE